MLVYLVVSISIIAVDIICYYLLIIDILLIYNLGIVFTTYFYSVDLCGTLDFPRKVRKKVTITLNIREHIENTIQRYSTKFNDIQRYSTIFNDIQRYSTNWREQMWMTACSMLESVEWRYYAGTAICLGSPSETFHKYSRLGVRGFPMVSHGFLAAQDTLKLWKSHKIT